MKSFNPGRVLSVSEVLELEHSCDVQVGGRITAVNRYGTHAPHLVHFAIEDDSNEMSVILPPSAWIWSVYVTCDSEIVATVSVFANEYYVRAIAESVWPRDTCGFPPTILNGTEGGKSCKCALPIPRP